MSYEVSHYCLMLALCLAFTLKHHNLFWSITQFFVILSICFLGAVACYMCSDFALYNIYTNSNANTPLFLKISATWSNHEGSLLLWCWLLSLYGFIVCWRPRMALATPNIRPWTGTPHHEMDHGVSFMKQPQLNPRSWPSSNRSLEEPLVVTQGQGPHISQQAIGVRLSLDFRCLRVSLCRFWKEAQRLRQPLLCFKSILVFFSAFCLGTSNPFLKSQFLCMNSIAELNPVLQDPLLVIHPPCIYAGYVASAVGFSFCWSQCLRRQPRVTGKPHFFGGVAPAV